MNTAQRAQAIAAAAEPFGQLLGPTTADDLLGWLRAELSDGEAIDRWIDHGRAKTKALPPAAILHIVSGNTPHAALQSLIGGLLLGSRNLVKLPQSGLGEVDEFLSRLPDALRSTVETATNLPDAWLASADAVIVYGSDETISALRSRVAPGKIFIGHGHKASLGIVWDDPSFASCAGAARDASLFDQQGCLSPQVFYVRESQPGFARRYAERLAAAMDQFNRTHPRGPLEVAEKAAIANLRAAYRFRAAGDLRVALWEGGGSMDWTVIYEEDAWFTASPLNRVIFVKPLPENLAEAMGPAVEHIGAVGLWPCSEELADRFAALCPSRFCPIGRMQDPPWTWHNGGIPRLA
ncbi:MAG: acyl-CoA reductase, partial [Chthoniobacterales bacterium]